VFLVDHVPVVVLNQIQVDEPGFLGYELAVFMQIVIYFRLVFVPLWEDEALANELIFAV